MQITKNHQLFLLKSLTVSVCVPVISTTALCMASANIIWTGILFSTSLPTTFTNDIIFIADSLIVNDTLEFFNCSIIMAGSASITVVNPGYLNLSGTIIQGCDTMWQGIYVNSQARVMVSEQSEIADANVAVLARHKSIVTVIDSKLANNARNVVIPVMSGITTNSVILTMHSDTILMDTTAFKPSYPGQPAHEKFPASGVETNNWTGTIGKSGDNKKNIFIDLITGITGVKSHLKLKNNEFGRIKKDTSSAGNSTFKGIAVFVSSPTGQAASSVTIGKDNYFYSCRYGTYTSNCSAAISEVSMDTMYYGVHVRNCVAGSTTRVEKCIINASYRGIDLLNNAGSSAMEIVGNTITITSDASATVAIKMQESSAVDPFYKIYDNKITIIGARDGIQALTLFGAVIKNNVITQSPRFFINSNRGININGCDSVTVSCNELVSTYVLNSGNYATGIGVSESKNSSIICNTVDYHHRGIFFGGICGATNFKGNRMGKHYVGLYLNKAAAIDQQPAPGYTEFNGNIWGDTTKYVSGYGAVNYNYTPAPNLALSLFTTNQTVVAHNPKYPTDSLVGPFYVDDDSWFNPQASGSSFLCATSTVCADTAIGGGEGLRMMIATDNTLTSEFIPESKMIASQFLYEELKKDSVLLNSNTTYQDFMQIKELESVGYLYTAKNAIKIVGKFDQNLISSIIEANNIINYLADSIYELDSLAVINPNTNYSDQREIYVGQIDDQQAIVEDALLQQKVLDVTLLTQVETANNLVSSTELPDENEKFINSMAVLHLKEGVNGIASYYSQILSIANQCPYQGGVSVYRARVFVSMLNEEVEYDDDAVCELQGIYRQSVQLPKVKIENGITIRPNPTSDFAEIILTGQHDGICNIEITDVTGRKIYIGSFDCKEKSKKVSIKTFSPGIYTVTVKINERFVKSSKLSIVR